LLVLLFFGAGMVIANIDAPTVLAVHVGLAPAATLRVVVVVMSIVVDTMPTVDDFHDCHH
jgi:hypothetical protein